MRTKQSLVCSIKLDCILYSHACVPSLLILYPMLGEKIQLHDTMCTSSNEVSILSLHLQKVLLDVNGWRIVNFIPVQIGHQVGFVSMQMTWAQEASQT